MAWGLASPVGASPDEDFHLVSTWCGNGLRDGVCEVGTDSTSRRVSSVLPNAACFAFDSTTSAACAASASVDSEGELVVSSRGNFSGDYPPVFYSVMNLFVGDDIPFSVVVMRWVNAALFVLMIAATYVASAPGLRRALLLGVAVTVVPLGMFIVPSINPSSWAVLSAATLAVSVLGYLTTEDRPRRLVLGALAAISLLIGAGARADAAMYAVIAVGAALLLAVRLSRTSLRRAIYPCVLAVLAVLAYLSAGQSSALGGGPGKAFDIGTFASVLIDVPILWVGSVGMWGLGWLDTTMPAVVWVVAFGLLAATLFAGLAKMAVRQGLAVAAVGLAVWVVPAYVQYLSGTAVGSNVQPRYILPLLTLLAVITLVRADGKAFDLGTGQRWVIVGGLAGANAVALHFNLRRYVTGSDLVSLNLDAGREWWWAALPVSPLGVWAVGALAFAGGLILLTRELTIASPAQTQIRE